MNNSNSIYRPLVLSATLGISGVAGFIFGKLLGRTKVSPEAILRNTINDFKREGTVEGSWIDHQIHPYQCFASKSFVYYGGIQRCEDEQLIDYRFIADAKTGSILKIKRAN
ncbi:hypothetical protein [uncultured Limosilactobacillus sp.]|uniref:hypothetical protein n=1 Tax=uncultured Limosilactobacillus sp. TaxID=2837629 RepID=UPI0025CD2369|nr:hypothetical protein [uncultured Limosilactobacillus sp.]